MQAKQKREIDFHNKSFGENTRESLRGYYAITPSSKAHYVKTIESFCANGAVLEYGCGPFSYSSVMVDKGARVTGIDLSSVALAQYRQRAERRRFRSVSCCAMNAESLAFKDNTFDLICGIGILHHLEIEKAYSEIARTLRSDGKAVFLEPLGHNPVINAYRTVTPHLRTVDEHPLVAKDLRRLKAYFGKIEMRFFYLTALAAIPLRRLRCFQSAVRELEALDDMLFRAFPYLRRFAWAVALILSCPSKEGGRDA